MKHFFTSVNEERDRFNQNLKDAEQIIIIFHQNPDGDALGSALGLRFFLENLGKKNVIMISPTEIADYLKWMPGCNEILIYKKELSDSIISEADLIFCLDFSSASRLKDMSDTVLQGKAPIVIIDHHESPEDFGNLLYWDTQASSTCELVFKLINDLEESDKIDLNVANCLYTGLLTDTGSFRFDSTSPQVHAMAGKLLEFGVRPSEINRSLFDNNTVEKLQFVGYVLSNKLVFLPEYRVAYMSISEEELKRYNSKSGDTEGLVNQALSIKNVVMAALFTEREGQIRISFRSIHDFSVADFSREYFEGGGHKNAAGGRSMLSLNETVEKFITLLPKIKNSLIIQKP